MAEVKKSTAKTKKKRKSVRGIDKGKVYVLSSFNNTIITFTDPDGNAICQSSAGALGFKGSRKSTPYAAGQAAETAAKKAKEQGIKSVEVFVSGAGNGREAAIRALSTAEINVSLIQDVSPIPHNGCRPPKRRRI